MTLFPRFTKTPPSHSEAEYLLGSIYWSKAKFNVSRILVVEDEPAIAESLAYSLGKADHEALVAGSLKAARTALSFEPDLLILDLMLPDGSGFDLIEELSKGDVKSPAVIVLSSRDGEADRVRALEMGADDYVTKPFSPREVLARVTAVLRRHYAPKASEFPPAREPALAINGETRRALVLGAPLELTRVEFDLLSLLDSTPGKVFSRSTIIDEVWGDGFALSDRTIDSHVKALRRKMTQAGGSGEWIETVRGVGYRIREEELRG